MGGLTANWAKSTRSNGSDGCVEARVHSGDVQIRDSKDPSGPALSFGLAAYLTFLTNLKTATPSPR